MNSTNSSQTASWSHSTASAVSNHSASGLENQPHGVPGTPPGPDHETKVSASSSPHSSNSATTLKEHDLLGLSEVSSSSTTLNSAAQNSFINEVHQSEELNLNLNLGLQDAKKKADTNRAGALQSSASVSEDGQFLGGLDGVNKNDEHNVVASERATDRGFSFSGLNGERGPTNPQGGRADGVENTVSMPTLETDCLKKWQQPQQSSHPPQQDEGSRDGYPGPLGGFPGVRVAFSLSKPGVAGAKRPFDRIGMVSEARNFNDARSGLPNPVNVMSLVVSGGASSVEPDVKSKVQGPLYPPWGSKPAQSWQMLQSSGGSFGPFPSQAPGRNSGTPASSKATGEAAGSGETAQKPWEGHTKGLQESAAVLGQMVASPTEAKPGPAQASPSPTSEAASAPRAATPPAHAVGWPPLRSFRKSTLAAQPRPTPVEIQPRALPSRPQAASPASVTTQSNFWNVKVHMDGVPIGRKVDLKTNNSYEKLSVALEEMFRGFVNGQQAGQSGRDIALPSDKRSFLHGSDYVLTYEDQDGDLMLVGDVPWTMFLDTVKRLRIMKGSEAIGLGSRSAEKVKIQPGE